MEEKIREIVLEKASGDTIYPKDIMEKFHISMKSAYLMLEKLVDDGLLTSVLEVWCPHCRRFTGLQYTAFWDIPKEVEMCKNSAKGKAHNFAKRM